MKLIFMFMKLTTNPEFLIYSFFLVFVVIISNENPYFYLVRKVEHKWELLLVPVDVLWVRVGERLPRCSRYRKGMSLLLST